MRQRSMLMLFAVLLCFAFIAAPLSQALAAGFSWQTVSIERVGITGPNGWFATVKADKDDKVTYLTFKDDYKKELLAIALTARSASLKVKALFVEGNAKGSKLKDLPGDAPYVSGCKGLYIIK